MADHKKITIELDRDQAEALLRAFEAASEKLRVALRKKAQTSGEARKEGQRGKATADELDDEWPNFTGTSERGGGKKG
jgi:Flp pilus assembly protein CpaB